MVEEVYLGLGSNLGNRLDTLKKALGLLSGIVDNLRCSRVYETLPRDNTDQGNFLNLVACGIPTLEPESLLDQCLEIEKQLGRKRDSSVKKGPRSCDIDILLFGNRTIQSPKLSIPHPRILQRAFVLIPLLDLSPELVHPKTGLPLSDALDQVQGQGVYYHSLEGYNFYSGI